MKGRFFFLSPLRAKKKKNKAGQPINAPKLFEIIRVARLFLNAETSSEDNNPASEVISVFARCINIHINAAVHPAVKGN